VATRLESDEFLMSTGSVRPRDDAYRISGHDLVGWTGELLVLDPLGALQLVGQTGLAPVANMVAPNYTRVAKLPRWALGGTQAYDGLHGRLRQTAAEYLAQRT
jgi:amidase